MSEILNEAPLLADNLEREASGMKRYGLTGYDRAAKTIRALLKRVSELERAGRDILWNLEKDWKPGTIGHDIILAELRRVLGPREQQEG